jgi:hypothetical protein
VVPEKPSFDMRPGGLDPLRVDELAARVEDALAGEPTAHEMAYELARIALDASETKMGYDTQQVFAAAEEWAKRYAERFPGDFRRFLGVSLITWRSILPVLVATFITIAAIILAIAKSIW